MTELTLGLFWISVFLGIGHVFKKKVIKTRAASVPMPIIAGFIGFLSGPEVLGKISPIYLSYDSMTSLLMPLLAITIITQFLGITSVHKTIGKSLVIFVLNSGTAFLQVFIGLSVTLCLISCGRQTPLGMGIMPFTGFYGGHGIPTAVSIPFDTAGYWIKDDSLSVGNIFATIGLLYGLAAGVFMVRRFIKNEYASGKILKNQLAEEKKKTV